MPPDTETDRVPESEKPVAPTDSLPRDPQLEQMFTLLFSKRPTILPMALFFLDHAGSNFRQEAILAALSVSLGNAAFQKCIAEIASAVNTRKDILIVFRTFDRKPPSYGISLRKKVAARTSVSRTTVDPSDITAQIDATGQDVQAALDDAKKRILTPEMWLQSLPYTLLTQAKMPRQLLPEHLQSHAIRVCLEYIVKHKGEWIDRTQLYDAVVASFRGLRLPRPVNFELEIHIRELMSTAREHTDTSRTKGFGIIGGVGGNTYLFDDMRQLHQILSHAHTADAEKKARWYGRGGGK